MPNARSRLTLRIFLFWLTALLSLTMNSPLVLSYNTHRGIIETAAVPGNHGLELRDKAGIHCCILIRLLCDLFTASIISFDFHHWK